MKQHSLLLASSIAMIIITGCTPQQHSTHPVTQKKGDFNKCLASVHEYMDEADAIKFCKQPKWCRKWWDDLNDQEKKEMQPPEWRKNPGWFLRC